MNRPEYYEFEKNDLGKWRFRRAMRMRGNATGYDVFGPYDSEEECVRAAFRHQERHFPDKPGDNWRSA